MIKSHFKKFATLSLSATLFAGIGITAAADATTAPVPVAQATLVVSNSITTGTVNAATGITLTASGGSGSGTLSFAIVTGADCKIKAGALGATAPGTCVVKATKAASHDTTHSYLAATSADKTFTFSFATRSSKLAISNSSTFAAVGQEVKVTTSDPVTADLGKVSFAISPTNSKCAVASNGTLTATAGTTCSVVATKAAAGVYGAATSNAVVFTFQPLTAVATVSSVKVSTTATGTFSTLPQINDTANGLGYFILAYYAPQDHWYQSYLPAGDYVQITYLVSDLKGNPVKQQTVSLADNLAYSGAHGTTWSDAALTADQGSSTATPKTDNMGHVTFTLHNTNSVTGLNPNDTTTAGAAEGNEGAYPWTRFVLKIGSTGKWTGALTDVNEATDLQDFIVVPGASAKKAQATLTVANATTAVDNGASVTLTTAGGSGSGAVSYNATGTGCTIASGVLSVAGNASASCSVTATKAADATYAATTSAAVTFSFGAAPDAPTAANPDNVSLAITGTGIVNSTPIENTNSWWSGHFGGAYAAATDWNYTYVHSGAQVTLTYTATGSYGQNLANTAVTLYPHFYGVGGTSLTATPTGATASLTQDQYNGYQATTDANGVVVFHFTLTGTATYVAADQTAGEANNIEYNNLDPYNRTVLQINGDVFTGGAAAVNEAGPMTDFIIVPSGDAPAAPPATGPTHASPDTAVMTSVTGGVNSTPIDGTADGDQWFINAYYSAADHWNFTYVTPGATITQVWHVTGYDGTALKNQTVTLETAFANGTATWSATGIANNGNVTGTTDSSGNVSFTLTNTNSTGGPTPGDTSTEAAALAAEGNGPWTRMVLIVGTATSNSGSATDVITANPNSTVNQATDLVDFIVARA
jgi:hypothetical protein